MIYKVTFAITYFCKGCACKNLFISLVDFLFCILHFNLQYLYVLNSVLQLASMSLICSAMPKQIRFFSVHLFHPTDKKYIYINRKNIKKQIPMKNY